uniref:TRAF-type domain-containing protein n=1 Tax=Macrostomum lignano TaxID=282301 RepID=A0A1I8GFY8_9PLAT
MTCPERPSDCKYRQSIGCQTNVAMSQLDEHYCSGTDGHLELTVQRFQQELQRKDSELKEINNLLMKLKTRDKQRAIEVGQLKEKVLKLTERLSTFEKSPLLKTLLNQGRRLSNGDLTEQPVEEDNQSQQDAAVKELNRMGRRRSLNSSITNDKHTSFKRRDALAQGIRWERQRFWCVYQAGCARVVENVLLGISTVIWFSCSPQAGIELQTTVQPPPPSAWLGTSLFLVATEPDVQAAELGVDEAQLLSVQHVGHDDEVGLVGADLPAPLPAGRAVHQPRTPHRWESNSGGQSFPGGRPGRCFTKTRPKAEQLALQSRTPLLHLSNTNSWQGPRAKLKAWQRGLLAQSSEHRTSDAAALLPRGVSVNSLRMHRLAFTAVNACCDEHRLLPAVTEITKRGTMSQGAFQGLGANVGRTAGISQQAVDETPSAGLPPPYDSARIEWLCQLESSMAQHFAGTGQAGAAIECRNGDSLVADLEAARSSPACAASTCCSSESDRAQVSALYNSTVSITAWNNAALWRSGRALDFLEKEGSPGKSTAKSQVLTNVRYQTAEIDELLTSRKPRHLRVCASAENCSLNVVRHAEHNGLLRVDHQADAATLTSRSSWRWAPSTPIPNHLMCSGCSELLINSYQTPHGCRLCQRCFSTELLQSSDRVCPCIHSLDSCRDRARLVEHFVSQAVCFPDTATRKDVLELEVRCPNEESGCEKQLTLKQLDSHLTNECQFEIVTCDRCSERVRQFELNGCHTDLRSPHCCSEFRAPCPHCSDSSSRLYRSEFEEHLMTCPERPSDCKYRQSIGCQTNVAMSQLDEHYCSGTDGHLELTVQRFQQELQRKDSELKEINNLLMKLKTRDKQRAIEVGQLKEKVLKLTERLSTFEKSPLLKTLLNQGRRLSNGDLTEQPVEEDNQSQQDAAVKELNRMGRRRSVVF